MSKILILNGPNLNLLGTREPGVYGASTLQDINKEISLLATTLGHEVVCKQSNAEHELIDAIHNAVKSDIKVILINPAAFTHTSIAIRDALLGVNIPFYEIHISDILNREDFRKQSFFSDIAEGVFSGMGIKGYEKALLEAISNFKKS